MRINRKRVSRNKPCIKCGRDEWHVEGKDYRCIWCRAQYLKRTADSRRNRTKQYDDAIWAEFFEQYGAQCVNCGETDKAALTVGHLNGDGAAHRQELKKRCGSGFLLSLRKLGWPKDKGLATQCASCQLRQVRVRWADPSHPFFSSPRQIVAQVNSCVRD